MVGKNEDYIETKAAGEMNDFDREMTPGSFRLDIPLAHSRDLRRAGEYLIALGGQLKSLSVRTDVPERGLLFQAWFFGRHCRYQLNLLPKAVFRKRNNVA